MTNKWDPTISQLAEILRDKHGGDGYDELTEKYGAKHNVSEGTIYRRVEEATCLIYGAVNRMFRKSRLGPIPLEFDPVWEMDAKVIPVVDGAWQSAGNFVHSYKNKGGGRVGQISLCRIRAIPFTKFELVIEDLGRGHAEDYAKAILSAVSRTGSFPRVLRIDPLGAQIRAYNEYFEGKFELDVRKKIGPCSQLNHVEGSNSAMDDTLWSGLHGGSYSEVWGHWLQKNFVEPKDDLAMTSFEMARGGQKSWHDNKWEFLLELTHNYLKFKKLDFEPLPHLRPKWRQTSLCNV